MSNCIRINGLENLPQEDTLLINYTILCTGVWDLAQMFTAYRNVCDTEWTVMYPNHQHPRHTDFPITVVTPGLPATFAWNYGGIRGIESENFDENHSYLTQLSIYNQICFNTGQPFTGSTEPSGATDPIITGEPGLPGVKPRPPVPPLPLPPFPPGGGRGQPGNIPSNEPSGVVVDPVIDPHEPASEPQEPGGSEDPVVGDPGGSGGGSGHTKIDPSTVGTAPLDPPREPGGGGITDPFISSYLISTAAMSPNSPTWDPLNSRGLSSNTVPTTNLHTNLTNQQVNPNKYVSLVPLSTPVNPNLFNQNTRNVAIPTEPPATNGRTFGGKFDVGISQYEHLGDIPGNLSNKLFEGSKSEDVSTTINLRQIDTSKLLAGGKADLRVSLEDVPQGEPLVISARFTVANGIEIQAKGTLYILDASGRGRKLIDTPIINITSKRANTVGISTYTTNISPGPATVIYLVTNGNDVVGVASKRIVVRAPGMRDNSGESRDTLKDSSRSISSISQPSSLLNIGQSKMSSKPIVLSEDRIIILNNTKESNKLSIAQITSGNYTDLYSLDESFNTISGLLSGNYIGTIDSKIMLDDDLYLPETHDLGVIDMTIPSDVPIVATVSKGELYLTDGFELRPITSEYIAKTLILEAPYINENLMLIINGNVSGQVPPNYSGEIATTNKSGVATWSNVTINVGQFYSIVISSNGVYNPYKNTIYNGQV